MSPLRDRTMGIVLAHGKALPAVQRHLPVWKDNASTLVFFTPVDDVLDLSGCPQYSIGKSDAYSAHTNQRCREALRFASYAKIEYVLLMEWDSLIFGPIPLDCYPYSWDATCPRFTDHPGGKFKGSQFLHFPILLSIDAVRRLVKIMDAIPLEAEGGLTDRYVGYAAELAGLKISSVLDTPLCYTWNHITDAMIPQAVEACRKGARWHHGIKDHAVFEAMQKGTTQAYGGT